MMKRIFHQCILGGFAFPLHHSAFLQKEAAIASKTSRRRIRRAVRAILRFYELRRGAGVETPPQLARDSGSADCARCRIRTLFAIGG